MQYWTVDRVTPALAVGRGWCAPQLAVASQPSAQRIVGRGPRKLLFGRDPASTTIKRAATLFGRSPKSVLTAASQLAPNRTRRTTPTRTPRIKTTLTAAAMILARTARPAR